MSNEIIPRLVARFANGRTTIKKVLYCKGVYEYDVHYGGAVKRCDTLKDALEWLSDFGEYLSFDMWY